MNADVIPSDEPSLFDVLASLSSLERRAIVRPDNPPPGIAGFLFDVVTEDAIDLTSDITDHYSEANLPLNDQIALRPETITVRGLVAELSNGRPSSAPLAPLPDALPLNEPLTPELCPAEAERQAEIEADAAREVAGVTSGQSLFGYFDAQSGQRPNQTKQAKAFRYFYELWKGRQVFSVETPWGIMNTMAIQTLRIEQPQETRGQSEVRVVFKKMHFAGEVVVVAGQLAGRVAAQAAPVTENGNAGKTEQTDAQKQSWFYRMLHPSP